MLDITSVWYCECPRLWLLNTTNVGQCECPRLGCCECPTLWMSDTECSILGMLDIVMLDTECWTPWMSQVVGMFNINVPHYGTVSTLLSHINIQHCETIPPWCLLWWKCPTCPTSMSSGMKLSHTFTKLDIDVGCSHNVQCQCGTFSP